MFSCLERKARSLCRFVYLCTHAAEKQSTAAHLCNLRAELEALLDNLESLNKQLDFR